jgi:hypothetical protein
MGHKLLGQPTLRQSQVELSAATANVDNEQTDDQIIEPTTKILKKSINNEDKLFVHYTREKNLSIL